MGERVKPILVLTKEEECTICLEAITNRSTIGIIPSCHHYYHDNCLLQWSSHSNSCPTCRKHFHKIENYHCQDLNKIVSTVPVRDRLLPNDAINHIPDEYVIRPHQQVPIIPPLISLLLLLLLLYGPPSTDDALHGVCSICSSADYRLSRTRSMIRCQICTSTFHLSCLGISRHLLDDMEEWYCPMCDSPQELIITPSLGASSLGNMLARLASSSFPSINSHSRTSPATNRRSTAVNRRNAPSTTLPDPLRMPNLPTNGLPFPLSRHFPTLPRGAGTNTSATTNSGRVAGRPGLVIHNDNDELDDDFLYSDNFHQDGSVLTHDTIPSYSRLAQAGASPVLNGGVMLRREMRNNQNLTEAELQSWNLFDEARGSSGTNESQIQSSSSNTNSAERKRRRRKRAQPSSGTDATSQSEPTSTSIPPNSGLLGSSTTTSSSRIASLMNQIKTPSRSTLVSRLDTSSSNAIPDDNTSNTYNNNGSTNVANSPSPSSISASPHSPSVYSGIESVDSDYQTDPEINSAGGAGIGNSATTRDTKRVCINGPHVATTNTDVAPSIDTNGMTKGVPELTFNQKNEIQRHIRNNLRPLYKPDKAPSENNNDDDSTKSLQAATTTTSTSTDPIIRSEASYISINKSISRKLYALILTNAKREDGCFAQWAIDEYFEHDYKLKQLVDKYSQDELTKL